MSEWIAITETGQIPEREGRPVIVGQVSIALFNTGAEFLAVENRCPHQGGPLADGILSGGSVVCPLHNWRVCLRSGSVVRPCDTSAPAARTFPVKVEEGVVYLNLNESNNEAAA
jgi:nitrite reductase (NADH) small subunit